MIKYARGFTIIETIVTIVIFTMMIAVVSFSIAYFYRANSYVIEQSYAINSARLGIETMVREIREATYSDTGAYPVVAVSETSFEFYSDIDRDNNIEKIRYFLDGNNFKKGEIQATGNPPVYQPGDETINILSEYVRNTAVQSVFMYYDESGAEISDFTNVADISLIKVHLIVNAIEGRAPDEFTLYSFAQLRNLKSNL
ncbi:prepilin-type N-terminal cleavage/methylation domain-containing protein [Patescibacteria group bacterium]|nr:prepilin-type N-terminal cleavage/methylation domain-containing protein [Patescibacteria group bacterium]MBU4353521.1 prepilin-type N-terminal cleavage/methylation domain-containing protein [Patescibacteria group bacterium]MBU4477435.1 prepilin-type N-terminal cleavage/methylation domain-containing protein [Patescibacteria group bacterium]MCG2699402.1 prepilin-type N-terminal cleavage/methylation domain-containing protein [Candidatus Parcubacteria bacterium]